jgi:hypothetical protein
MNASPATKVVLVLALMALAGWLGYRAFRETSGVSEKAYFYDLSQKKLFATGRNRVPPIRGVDGEEEDAVRAVVISTNGRPEDKRSRRIAYLEKYSPELKRQMEAAQAAGASPPMGRALAQEHRFVRRLQDPQWFPLSSAEGEKIVSEWATPGPDGVTPAVVSP